MEGDSEGNSGGQSTGIAVGNDYSSKLYRSNSRSSKDDGPREGMEFKTEEAAKAFYDSYARRTGFSIQVGRFARATPDGPIVTWDYTCSREVFVKKKNLQSCDALLRIIRNSSSGTWVVSKFVEDHNHPMLPPSKVHNLRSRKASSRNTAPDQPEGPDVINVDPPEASSDEHARNSETPNPPEPSNDNNPARMSSPFDYNQPSRSFAPVHFIRPHTRKRMQGRDAQNLLNYFKKMQAQNPGFFYAIQIGEDFRMTNAFWADARSRNAYNSFGDAVVFDTMYRPNQYLVPFAPFTGVNHHGQLVLFGCGLIVDESESSFTWLFRTFLSAMNERLPASITTDQDRAIKAAAQLVFPGTRHCICKWHILREGQERLAHVYLAHPSFYGELYSCINYSETVEDFESSWVSLLDKYDLQKNEWLQAVYNAREQWAPVFFRGNFFAALSSNQGVTCFFDGYLDQHTSLPVFFKQYERALEHSLEKEIEADYDTICTTPVLKTPSPMEQQAANLYTKKVFAKFQEELVETFAHIANKIECDGPIAKYRVAKYEHDDRAFMVILNISELKASCSCQMFEYSGILCRHILTVFTVTNVLTLPSHYILKRWTGNAKSLVVSDEQPAEALGIETLTMRFNNLCREAIKYAEEGAIAPETYNAAITALREAVKKVSVVKKGVAKVTTPNTLGSGNSFEDNNMKIGPSVSETIPSAWPWQDAIPHRFNLNDTGISVGDVNQPSITPVSIHRDVVPPDSMVVLTCFKSMTWAMESDIAGTAGKVAVINLKLEDYGKNPLGETNVQFRLTRVTLEPMLKSMVYINQQLSAPANKVAVINLKLQDTKTSSGETEVKFQVSKDTLGHMMKSMAFIRKQL